MTKVHSSASSTVRVPSYVQVFPAATRWASGAIPAERAFFGRGLPYRSSPSAYEIRAPRPARDLMASSGLSAWSGITWALPPPLTKGREPVGPTTAMLRAASPVRGRAAFLLCRRVAPALATSRATAAPAAGSRRGRGGALPSSRPKSSIAVRMRRTDRSTYSSETPPSWTAFLRAAPKYLLFGISMSRPAVSEATVLWAAYQSVITQPSKPQRSRRMSVRSSLFSQA